VIKDDDREILIQYRLNQSIQTIGEVSKLIEVDLLKVAVNRTKFIERMLIKKPPFQEAFDIF